MSFFTTEALPVLDGMFKQIRRSHNVENEVPKEANPEIRR